MSAQNDDQIPKQATDLNDSVLDMMEAPNAEQKEKIGQLKDRVEKEAVATLPPEMLRSWNNTRMVFLVRHLIARKWDVDAALAMIQKAARWRTVTNLDRQALFPNPLAYVRGYNMEDLIKLRGCGERQEGTFLDGAVHHLRRCAGSCWHKWDKKGRPVYIERSGHFKVKELVERCKSLTVPGGDISRMCIDLHVISNEIGGTLVRYCNEKGIAKAPVTAVTAIIDCEGLSMDHLYGPALDILKAQGDNDKEHYAEGLNRIYVVNCPTIVTLLWNIVKLWSDERTRNKVSFHKPGETTEALLEAIDAENLPKFLGGKCECDGDCCPDVGSESAAPLELGGTKEILVKAGAVETIETEMPAKASVKFHLVIPQNDVIFGVRFESSPSSGAASASSLQIREATKTQGVVEQSFSSPTAGKVIFTFDNSYSWMRSKTLVFRADVVNVAPASPAASSTQIEDAVKA